MLFEEKEDNLESFWLTIYNEQLVTVGKAIIQLLLFSSIYMYEVGFAILAFTKSVNKTAGY